MSRSPTPELWVGVEATVNRVGDRYFDQLERSGHADRDGDLARLAQLGASRVRYPVLWERVAPEGLAGASWEWSDRRLGLLTQLGLEPIVGLLHHGSGPRETGLLDPDFPERLAEYAHAVALRYPGVRLWTPVNEPLTTARFAALYGHWHPHAADDRSFLRALVNQCRGVALAMEAIRAVVPAAELVQTEDIGETHSTPLLAGQAAYENERRWLSLDLLCGRVDDRHRFRKELARAGVPDEHVEGLVAAPCAPDVMGLNYYVTSERFLDERLERYPAWAHGGNGSQRYADVEAPRVFGWAIADVGRLLRRAWARYGRPLALTEVHLGGPRDEQLRWLGDAWDAACELLREGVDVRAVAPWAAFGSYDWNTLCREERGFYEPGLFDVRSAEPRPTALARMVGALAVSGGFDHPALDADGWWRRAERTWWPLPAGEQAPLQPPAPRRRPRRPRPLIVTGAGGTLGAAFRRVCVERGLELRALCHADLDVADPRAVEDVLDGERPWAVVNAAGWVRVDEAEAQPRSCFRTNVEGVRTLGAACAARGVALAAFSSDLVFGGELGRAYVESDEPRPLGVYGASKHAGERALAHVHPEALVARTSAFFGPWDSANFAHAALAAARSGTALEAGDEVVSPTYVPHLVHAVLDLLVDGESGVWHLANQGALAWPEFAGAAARAVGSRPPAVRPPATRLAPRPRHSALTSERAALLPPLEDALAEYALALAG